MVVAGRPPMTTRVCAACGDAKPVSNIWYAIADRPSAFLCGTCFHQETGQRAGSLHT